MGKQALTWIGAAACSVLLIVAGGLVVGTVAVHRYLQSSSASVAHSGFWRTPAPSADASPDPGLMPALNALDPLPGVSSVEITGATELRVTMRPDASPDQSAAAVTTAAQFVKDADVELQLRVPATDARASAVAEFRDLLKAGPSGAQTSQLVDAMLQAAEVNGVAGVRVEVPSSWDLTSSAVAVSSQSDAEAELAAVRAVLSGTALDDASVQARQ